MSNTELVHWGIKGQKWGVRRYQNPDGTLTEAGKKRYLNPDGSLNSAGKRRLKKIKKEEEKKEEETRTHEEQKRDALQKGNATEILKFKGELTNQEMKNAIDRIDLERKLSELSAKEIAEGQKQTKSALDTINDIANTADKVKNLAEKGIGIYNTIAKVNNSLSEDELPVIGDKTRKSQLKEAADKKAKEERTKKIRESSLEDIIKDVNKYSSDELREILNLNENRGKIKEVVDKPAKDTARKEAEQKIRNMSIDQIVANAKNMTDEERKYAKTFVKDLRDISGKNNIEELLKEVLEEEKDK